MPDPLRLAWRDFIKQTIRDVIRQPELDPLASIQRAAAQRIPKHEQSDVQALLVDELRRLHEGVLARYGLRPSEYVAWKLLHGHRLAHRVSVIPPNKMILLALSFIP